MTCRELYSLCRKTLSSAGIDSPGNEAVLLAEHFLGLDRPGLAVHGDKIPAPEQEQAFLRAVSERAARRPLQYILGQWDFLGLTLAVGEGVLVPREDTAVLVEALAEKLKDTASPRGLDLCAGTGAVGLGLCSLLESAEVLCLEISAQAFPFLKENIAAHPQYRARAVKSDILRPAAAAEFAPGSLDFIASNPPYIKSGELPGLQAEVQKEPALALDGGQDGLTFYRAITELRIPLLKPGGVLAVEIGEGQAQDVRGLFQNKGLSSLEVRKDWAGLDRCVLGIA